MDVVTTRVATMVGLAALALTACGGTNPSIAAAPSFTPVPSGTTAPTAAEPPSSTAEPTPQPTHPGQVDIDTVAEVVTTDLVIRSAPGTGSDSEILATGIDAPQLFYVMDGPVRRDGYDWYLVDGMIKEYLPFEDPPTGWVAAASRDGEPWIGQARLGCPGPVLEEIVQLNGLAMLACFGSEPLMLVGEAAGCVVADPVSTTPTWLSSTGCGLIVEGYEPVTTPSSGWMIVRFAPYSPAWPNQGTLVTVFGHFDDPAARSCESVPVANEAVRLAESVVLACRTQFVVTRVRLR